MTKKKMTIEDLAERMDKGFKSVNSRIDSTKEDLTKKIGEDTEFLARITQDGFREAEKKHNKAHRIIQKRIKEAELDVSGTKKIAMLKVKRDDNQDLKIKLIGKRVRVLKKQVL